MTRYLTYRNKSYDKNKYAKVKDALLELVKFYYSKYASNLRVSVVFGGIYDKSQSELLTIGEALRTGNRCYEIRISSQIIDDLLFGNGKLFTQTLIHEFLHIYNYNFTLSCFKKYNPFTRNFNSKEQLLFRIGYEYYSELFAYYHSFMEVKKVKGNKVKDSEIINAKENIKNARFNVENSIKKESKQFVQCYMKIYKEQVDTYIYLLSKYIAYNLSNGKKCLAKDKELYQLIMCLEKLSYDVLLKNYTETCIIRIGRYIYEKIYFKYGIKIKKLRNNYYLMVN